MSFNVLAKTEYNTGGYLKLISLVKQHPILYNRNEIILDSYNFRINQKETNRSWQLIASELGISVGECKKRWKTLKETFLRVHKRNLEHPNKKKWVYEDALSFLINSKNKNNQVVKMENIIQVNSEDIQEGTVEYLELDMDSMGDSEYYIMDTSMIDKESGEIVEITTPLQQNQVIVNNKTVPKYITICDNSQNGLENATILNIGNFDKNNFIITTPVIQEEEEEEENTEYILADNIGENVSDEISMNGMNDKNEMKEIVKNVQKEKSNKFVNMSKKKIKRINELLHMPGNEKNIDNFFENMAAAVLKLPTKLQAEVKMEICNIVSMAEITYSQKTAQI